jgi:hypothetical protein
VHAKHAALRRLNDNEGQNALLRSRVERAERERREMQTRVSQTSQGGLAAATSADLQRQLDIARQQLAFKEQEVWCLAVMIFSLKARMVHNAKKDRMLVTALSDTHVL